MFVSRKTIRFLLIGFGIFATYFIYGLLQEKITRTHYVRDTGTGHDHEMFRFSSVLIAIQVFVNAALAKLLLLALKLDRTKTPMIYLATSSLTYCLAMIASTMALQWVSYPTQVIGKSGKPIIVIVFGMLLGNKKYPLRKYAFVLLIVIGVMMFIYKPAASGKSNVAEASAASWLGLGELLIFLSLFMDGITAAIQERMKSESKTTPQHMMYYMNAWAVLFCSVFLVCGTEAAQFYAFVQRHPDILAKIAVLAVTGSIGQLFIFFMVAEFGPLPCSIITTTRKFFTILASVIFFGNTLTMRQWLATVLVFSGLFLDSLFAKSTTKAVKSLRRQDQYQQSDNNNNNNKHIPLFLYFVRVKKLRLDHDYPSHISPSKKKKKTHPLNNHRHRNNNRGRGKVVYAARYL